MRAAALSFAEADFTTRQGFLDHVYNALSPAAEGEQFLLVFPAHLALLFAYRCGDLGSPADFAEAASAFLKLPPSWSEKFLDIQRAIALSLQAYLVPGSFLTAHYEDIFHTACLFSPEGEVLGYQQQLFLSREERNMGWSRGEEAVVFQTGLGQLGIIIGTDAWYPEVSRVLALKGSEIVCHCGALDADENKWRQVAGMWQQVQHNRFFCVESQLTAAIAGRKFGASCLIHAPCEMTPAYEGLLAKGEMEGEVIEAILDREIRQEVSPKFPLLQLLKPAAYHGLAVIMPEESNDT